MSKGSADRHHEYAILNLVPLLLLLLALLLLAPYSLLLLALLLLAPYSALHLSYVMDVQYR